MKQTAVQDLHVKNLVHAVSSEHAICNRSQRKPDMKSQLPRAICIQQENNSTGDTIFNVIGMTQQKLSYYVTKNKPQEQVKNIT